jgi:hypothetical protein
MQWVHVLPRALVEGWSTPQNAPAPCHHTGSLTTSVIAATASAPNSLKTSDRKVILITKMSHVVVSVQRRWKEALSGASVQYMIHCFSLGDMAKLDFSPADLQVASRPDVLTGQIRHIPLKFFYVAPTVQSIMMLRLTKPS